jgi:hypothetical protein
VAREEAQTISRMILRYSRRFLLQYSTAPAKVREAFDKQSSLLLRDLRYPLLRAKKYDDGRDIWHARMDSGRRVQFTENAQPLPKAGEQPQCFQPGLPPPTFGRNDSRHGPRDVAEGCVTRRGLFWLF